jgi:prepilin-type N-terminal cleavage/methylation domain-containing protein
MSTFRKSAFTLIELLVVIAIIGILSGLIVVMMGEATNKANIAKTQVFSNSLRNSLMLNLISEWKLNGNAIDAWGNSIQGTLIGGVSTNSNCVYESCLSFDGVDDYVQINSTALRDITKDFTFTAWFKRIGFSGGTDASSYHGIARTINGDNWYPRILVSSGGNMIYLQYRDNSPTPVQYEYMAVNNINFDLGKWHFLTVTKGSFGVKIYFDDKQVGQSPTLTHTMKTGVDAFLIGCGASPIIHYMANGTIDDVHIFKEAISMSQIKEQYYSGLNNLFISGQITKEEYANNLSVNNNYAQY